jgi:small subunit ribosomal protein S1
MILDDDKEIRNTDDFTEREEVSQSEVSGEGFTSEAVTADESDEMANIEAMMDAATVREVVVETTEIVETVVEVPVEVVPEPVVEAIAPVVVEAAVVVEAPAPVIEVAAPVAAVVAAAVVAPTPAPTHRPSPTHGPRTSRIVEVAHDDSDDDLDLIELIPVGGADADIFDWSMDRRGAIHYKSDDRARMLIEFETTMKAVAENEIVKGRVTAISGGDVVLDINAKSDGLVAQSEFRDFLDLKPGDEVEVYVENQEDARGQLGLSRRKAKILRAWERIVDSFNNGTVITGTVISKTKGGLIVECGGLETFLPGSQIDIKPIIDYDQYVGKSMEFKVVKINEQIKNAVVSHKALIESDLAEQRETILGGLEKGQVLEGIVKNITDFGAFLDLGGVDGLLYITDISWGRITHPSQVLALNQRLSVVVLEFDENKKRISLGLKQLLPHPWEVLASQVVEGSTVKGRIVNIEDYGAFVEIQPGVEGLIHISEISWGNQSTPAKEFFKMDQEIEAKVVTIDRDERKMSLSIKQLTNDPWSIIDDKFPVGSRHNGEVKNITNYGIFVELAEGIGGMIHISDLSWTKRYAHPSEFAKAGQKIEVIILEVDKDKHQISLGHKQLEDNPWVAFQAIFPEGSVHEATVLRRDDKGGAILQLAHGLEAFAPQKHIRKEDGTFADAGEVLSVKVIEFNADDRRIVVSHSRVADENRATANAEADASAQAEVKAVDDSVKKVQTKVERNTLGDLDILNQLKDQLDK